MTSTRTRRTLTSPARAGALVAAAAPAAPAKGTEVRKSGSFEGERRVANRAGTDTITAYARHAASGQTCSARRVFPG